MKKKFEPNELTQVIVKLSQPEKDVWCAFADAQGMSLSTLMRQGVRGYIAKHKAAVADADRFAAIKGLIND